MWRVVHDRVVKVLLALPRQHSPLSIAVVAAATRQSGGSFGGLCALSCSCAQPSKIQIRTLLGGLTKQSTLLDMH